MNTRSILVSSLSQTESFGLTRITNISCSWPDQFNSFAHSLDPNAFSGELEQTPTLMRDSRMLLTVDDIGHTTPKWKPYAESCTNYVFDVSDSSLLVHNEPDTYRREGIDICIRHIQ